MMFMNNQYLPLPGIQSHYIQTERLLTHLLVCGDENATPLIFIHGNFSAATYFEELMLALSDQYYCIAVDLRGYGQTEDLPIDASRGARDWSDDLFALFETLEIDAAHLMGWSAGCAAIMQFAIDHASRVESLSLIAPVSPFGFGGSKDLLGNPCHKDFAGSGGGVVSPEFVQHLHSYRQNPDSLLILRDILNQSLVYPPFQMNREEQLLTASLQQKLGEQRYPGDSLSSPNWPYVCPGQWGPINAVSAKYLDLGGIVKLRKKPPILWLHGNRDTVISDRSMADPAVLGEMKLLPGWPGGDVYPSQPMVSQTRSLLDCYQNQGGLYQEVLMNDVGHSPFLEKPEQFLNDFLHFLSSINS